MLPWTSMSRTPPSLFRATMTFSVTLITIGSVGGGAAGACTAAEGAASDTCAPRVHVLSAVAQ